jgi:predicted outer membrane repeat protein
MNRLRGGAHVLAALVLLVGPASAHAGICYVKGTAAGANDGSSWSAAYKDLQSALGNASCTEVWVAAFVYKPSANSAAGSFNIAPGVGAYGGFAGTETQRTQRNPAANLTVLSGDLDDDDCGGSGCANGVTPAAAQISGINSAHVVTIDGTGSTPVTPSTVLDGFTITGGLYCHGEGAGKTCSPMLANLVFSGNRTNFAGGALFDMGDSGGVSSPVLSNVVFRGNSATNGGAMYNDGESGGISSPALVDVTFSDNSATQSGGAMYNDGNGGASNPSLNNVTFSGNSANSGGAMFEDGAVGASSPTLANVTFSGNSAQQYGGAMFNGASDGGVTSPMLTNVTFSGNSATLSGGAIDSYAFSGTCAPVLVNVILWADTAPAGAEVITGFCTPSISYSVVQGGCPPDASCSHLVTNDPLLGQLRNNGGMTQTRHLATGSAAIDAGSDSDCPAADQRGVSRPQGSHCDIGAVEVDRIFADNLDGTPTP